MRGSKADKALPALRAEGSLQEIELSACAGELAAAR